MSETKPAPHTLSDCRRDGVAAFITVHGEIDLHNSPELRTELLHQLADGTVRKLVLNLADVPYMDSSAIAVMVEALQKLRKSNGKIYLTALQPRVKGLLEIARLDTIFCVVKDQDAALADPA